MASSKSVDQPLFSYDDFSDYDDYDADDGSTTIPCRLAEIPPELHRTIIDVLRGNIAAESRSHGIRRIPKQRNSRGIKQDDQLREDNRRKRCAGFVHDLANWSSTSQFFRHLLAPYIFKAVHLTNEDYSGSSAAALSESLHNKHVKELSFSGWACASNQAFRLSNPPDAWPISVLAARKESDVRHTESSTTILPTTVSSVLSNLNRFPNLDTIRLELTFDPCDIDLDPASEETVDFLKSVERTVPRRALAARTWEALSQNRDVNVKTLDIIRFGPISISTYSTPAFRTFLSQVECFKFSVWDKDGSPVAQDRPPMSMLDVYFFNNLVSVTKFVLKAIPEGPLGLVGSPHRVPLKLKKEQMPNVKTVCLEYIFICPELIDFLAGHQKTLESLSLHRCSASRKSMARDGIPWKDLFDCLYSSGFNKFRHLEVVVDRAPYRDQSWDLGGFRDDEDGREDERIMEAAKQVRHLYRQNQHRITFPYTWLSTQTGLCLEDFVENLRAFELGHDQASYDKLMHKLKTNANNYGSSQG